jgi:hypothetical protein
VTTAHEPRRGPGTHLSDEELSALAEGAQPGAAGRTEHLEGCAECRAAVDALSDLLMELAEFDAPALPQDVAIRIDAALARESMARTAGVSDVPLAQSRSADADPDANAASARGAVGDGVPARSRRARRKGFGWGLASLVLVLGGVVALVDLTSSSAVSSGSATAASGEGQYRSIPKSNGVGPHSLPQLGPAASESATAIASAPLVVWVRQLLARTPVTGKLSSDAGSAAVINCQSDPRFADVQQLGSTTGTFDGREATLVVYADGAATSTVYAVAYAAPCSASNFTILNEGVVSR